MLTPSAELGLSGQKYALVISATEVFIIYQLTFPLAILRHPLGKGTSQPRTALVWLLGALAGAAAFPAQALETRELLTLSVEELLQVPLTGSHIKRADTTRSISIIDRNTIVRSGASSVEILLQRLAFSAGYAGNQTNAYWAVNGNGNTHVNLRGLGIGRTLVLLNGRRLANGGMGANAAVDLNSISLATIDRIEILKDGASAIYGADAVAGVVNIITRTDLTGVEASVRAGESTRDDGTDRSAELSWGGQNDSGNFMVSLSHSATGAVNMATRAPCGLGEVGGQLLCVNSGNTIGGRALLADGQAINFNQTLGGNGDGFEPYSAIQHNFNPNPYLNAVNPNERTSLNGSGRLIFSDSLSTFAELNYSERHSSQLASPGVIGLNRAIHIPASNLSNPTGQDLLLQRRRLLEAGPRQFLQDTQSIDSVLGLKGNIQGNWDWSAAIDYRRNTGRGRTTNIANLDHVDNTLNPSLCSYAPGAAVPCADYLGYGDVTPAVLDYLIMTTQDRGGNEQKGFSASITGQAWELSAGEVALATGLELRSDHGWLQPDAMLVQGSANNNIQKPTNGSLSAREAFVEIDIPLLKQRAWAQSLHLNSALRHSDYDLFGSVNNYQLGIDWQALSSVNLRAHYATAFRAPNVPELFAGNLSQNLNAIDPCNNWEQLPASSNTYRNCMAAGVPMGLQQLAPSMLTTLGGNTQLNPERAKTFTLGAIWEPNSETQLRVEYFHIALEDAIGSADGSTKLAACYASANLSHPFCSSTQFTRNSSTGQINYLSAQPENAASEDMSGIDLGAHYQFALADWQAALKWDIAYLRHYDLVPFEGAQAISYAGKITSGRGSYTHWRSLAELSLARGAWSSAYTLQYLGSAQDIAAPAGSLGAYVPSVTYHNVQTQYAFSSSLSLALGIDNLTDRKAPFVRNWLDANTDTMTYDLLGRRWFIQSSYRW